MAADSTLRGRLAAELEGQIRPLIDERCDKGGYNCCGCSTYDAILDHAIRIVKGEDNQSVYVPSRPCPMCGAAPGGECKGPNDA